MDLGSALAGLGCPVVVVRTDRPPGTLRAFLWLLGSKEVRICPGCAHLDWPENAGSTGSPNLFLWLTNSHNAFPNSRACLHRALEFLAIQI